MAAMGSGGPAKAVGICRTEAPEIASRVVAAPATSGWTIGRTSRKFRNAANEPNDWQKKGLAELQRRIDAGESPAQVSWYDESDGQFRYMSPIMTVELCVSCHGPKEHISEDVKSRLRELYPEDRATGFSAGDLRGAFVVTGPLGT